MSARRFGARVVMVIVLPFAITAAVLLRIWTEMKSIPKYAWWDACGEVEAFKASFKKGSIK